MYETTGVLTEPAEAPESPAEPELMDEGLHFGRAWHRYGYCFRQAESLRILDAGCGTGRSSVAAARLNPGSTVVGVDASAEAIGVARSRRPSGVDFRVHDPAGPWPEGFGRFDFVVCLGALGRSDDPPRLLANLAAALGPAGLLLVTAPSHAGALAARSFRQAVATLAPVGSGDDDRFEVGLELFESLRGDHPIRADVARRQQGRPGLGRDDVLAGYLTDRNDWTLDDALGLLKGAGLKFLDAATPWRWRADRVLSIGSDGSPLRDRVEGLGPARLSRLIDALDPALLGDEYRLYACPAAHDPVVPTWPATRSEDPATFDCLVPRLTGLAEIPRPGGTGAQGRVGYRTVSGAPGELDRWSALRLEAVDGIRSCGEIEGNLVSQTRASDDLASRRRRWIDLADCGLVLLGPA